MSEKVQKAWAVVYGPRYPNRDEGCVVGGALQMPIFWTRAGAKTWLLDYAQRNDWRIVSVAVSGVKPR